MRKRDSAAAALALVCVLLAAGCGTSKPGNEAGARAPVITSAVIEPASPLANSNVTITIAVDNPSGEALTYRSEWYVNGRLAQQGDGSEFLTQGLSPGTMIKARIIANDGARDSKPFETTEVTVAENLSGIDSLQITPNPVRTGSSSVSVKTFFAAGASPNMKVNYRWTVSGKEAAVSGPVMALNGLKAGDKITVEATPAIGKQTGNPFRVSALVVSDAPVIQSISVTSQDSSGYNYQVTASDPNNGTLSYQIVSGPAGAAINSSGLLRVPIAAAGQGVRIRITNSSGNWIERELKTGD